MRNYKSRARFWAQLHAALGATFLCLLMAFSGHLLTGLVLFTLVACSLNSLRTPQGRLCAVTLSVPEILKDILDAFKLETLRSELLIENSSPGRQDHRED
jgi:hypothetical protein